MPNSIYKCPECGVEMNEVYISSHYGIKIILEQCPKCGGLWFDDDELYMAKEGSAKDIDNKLDACKLRQPTNLTNPNLLCPKDGEKLKPLTDKYFPQNIKVEICPKCASFWLNCGEFIEFQEYRKKTKLEGQKNKEIDELEKTRQRLNEELNRKITAILASSQYPRAEESKETEDLVSTIIFIIWTLIRLFILKS